jgi:hypothetical protein
MALVRLVGQKPDGCRILLPGEIPVRDIGDVRQAFARHSLELAGSTGYLLGKSDVKSEALTENSFDAEVINQGVLDHGLTVLYLVNAKAKVPAEEAGARARRFLDVCLGNGVSLSASRILLRDPEIGLPCGWWKLEKLWRESLVLRDLAFLADSKQARMEKRLWLLHDLCPMSKEMTDSRKLGHLTAEYKDEQGNRRYHTLSVYLEVSSSGDAQDRQLQRTLDQFSRTCELMNDEAGFDESCFAGMLTDRGASLGKFDRLIARLFEPVHRLHLVVNNVIHGCQSPVVVRLVCGAANFAASSPEFQAYMTSTCAEVRCITGLLWQRASNARFASAVAACFVLSTRIEGRPLFKHIADYFSVHAIVLETSKGKRDMLECFSDDLNASRIERLGIMFATVIYPIVRLLGHVAKKEQTDEKACAWLTHFFLSNARSLSTVSDRALERMIAGESDCFGNKIMCHVDPNTCSFRTSETERLPVVHQLVEADVLPHLPADVRTHGVGKYYGSRGQRKSSNLMPSIRETSTAVFLRDGLTRMAVGFYAETVRYPVPPKLEKQRCDVGLGPMVVEGICGRMKRVFEMCQHGRLRDECARAMVCAREDLDRDALLHPIISSSFLSEIRNIFVPESTEERKKRIGVQRLSVLKA